MDIRDLLRKWQKETSGTEWAGARFVRETQRHRVARDGKPETIHTAHSEGVMIEVLVGGQFGYAATPTRSPHALQEAFERAHRQATVASKHALSSFTSKARPTHESQYQSPVKTPFAEISDVEVMNRLVQISEHLRSAPRIVRGEAVAIAVNSDIELFSTDGAHSEQEFSWITVDFSATAQRDSEVQNRSDGGGRGRSVQGGWEVLFDPTVDERVRRVVSEAAELLDAEECPTGKHDLILLPDQMMLQIHESIGHPLELDRILGDERNYAGWSFVKLEDFGKLQYGSDLMNVTFDPTVPGEFASYGLDDSGLEARREFLIQGGKLLRPLGGKESQLRSGLPGVANSRASSWNRAPIDRMANLNLEAGTSSMSEMIAAVEDGVMMESNRSWSIDDFRNKFQFGCEYGKRIKNGKIVGAVKNPNYRGVTVPFWTSLKKVGNIDTLGAFGTPYCGKGEPNQAIRVGHRSPACLFSQVDLFGGGA